MNGYPKYSTSVTMRLKIAENIVSNCNLSEVEFFTPDVVSKPQAYKASYTDPTKDSSKHITLSSNPKEIKVTANWLEEDGKWYDTAIIEKDSGMGIFFCKEPGTLPSKENPTITFYYIFTEKDKSYTFTFASNTVEGDYHEEILECRAGGGNTNLFNLNDNFKNAKAEVTPYGSYKIDDLSTIFDLMNYDEYEDLFVKLTFNSGDIYWFDTQYAGTEIDYIINHGKIDNEDYKKLLKGKTIDTTRETYTNLNKRDKWFMELNLLVKFTEYDALYTIKNIKADSDFSRL